MMFFYKYPKFLEFSTQSKIVKTGMNTLNVSYLHTCTVIFFHDILRKMYNEDECFTYRISSFNMFIYMFYVLRICKAWTNKKLSKINNDVTMDVYIRISPKDFNLNIHRKRSNLKMQQKLWKKIFQWGKCLFVQIIHTKYFTLVLLFKLIMCARSIWYVIL